MALDEVLIGDEVRVTATLRYTNEDGELVAFDPTRVSITIKDADGNTIVDDEDAEYLYDDIYYYDFIITNVGLQSVIFIVEFASGQPIQINQKIYASSITEQYKPSVTLKNDETILFASEITPLYIDPESILPLFPDASLLEIGEIIYHYSLEIKSLLKLDDKVSGDLLLFTVLDYIRAATACELSRTYAYGGGDEVAVRLGDFSLENRNIPRSKISRDNAATWCQIATALRKEVLAVRSRGTVIQPKGLPVDSYYKSGEKDIYTHGQEKILSSDPMPSRKLKRYD